ncbi:MAG TPA: flippase [Candidatus Acidoferrales bacterium]|nr:flippase [Candidatus Acidoferrales bacterium]
MPTLDQSSDASEVRVELGPAQAANAADKSSSNDFLRFSKRSSHFLGGTICLFLLGFISFPILARIFSVEEYGLISLVSNTIAVAVVFSKFGLQASVQRFYKEQAVHPEPGALRRYYSTVYLGAAGNGFVVTLIFLAALWLVPASLMGTRVRIVFSIAAGLILLRSISSMITNLLQVEGRTFAWNVLQIATKAATIAMTLSLLLFWNRTPSAFFIGMVFVEATAVLFVIPYLRRRDMLSLSVFNKQIFREIMIYGLPMMAAEIFYLILDTGDRFLVEGFLGARPLGLYAAAYNISGYVRDSLSSPLQLALFPIVMEIWVLKGSEKTREFLSRAMNYFVLAGIAVVALASACSSDVINLIASPKFHEAHHLLPYILIGMLANAVAMFLKSGLLIHKKTYLMMKVIMASCIVNILMNVILLPRIGLLGAAIATLGSYVFSTSMFAWLSRKYLPLQTNWFAWLRYAAVGCFTWYLSTRIEIHSLLLSLVVRGTICLFIYAAILWLIDTDIRTMTSEIIGLVKDWFQQKQLRRNAAVV